MGKLLRTWGKNLLTLQNSLLWSSKCRSLPRGRERDPATTVGSWDHQRGLTGVPGVQSTTGRNPTPLQIHMYHGTDIICTSIYKTTNARTYPVGQTLGQTASFRQTAPETRCQSDRKSAG